MTSITIRCPECGCERETARAKIPPRPVRAVCPQCQATFSFTAHLAPPAPEPAEPVASVPLPPSTPRPRPPRRTTRQFVFTGKAGEYFGIWIVNLLLKIVTLGIYSSWAKVRKRRYFYGNTLLDDAPFDYTADPMALFKGWCLGVLAFLLYSVGTQVSPILGAALGFALFLAIPWVIVRARLFSARNSAHRNIRFNFRPNYREAYVIYAGLPFLLPFTLGLIFPYMIYRQKKFHVENSGFGRTPFTFTASAGDFYRLFLKVLVGLLLMVAALGVVAALLARPLGGLSGDPAALASLFPLMAFAIVPLYLFVAVYVQTELTNLTWNATRLGDARLVSTLRTRDMAWLYLSSVVAIVCSFGLLIPWAGVRLARYRFEQLGIAASGELRTLAAEQAEVGAAGEEFGDIFGIEVGLG